MMLPPTAPTAALAEVSATRVPARGARTLHIAMRITEDLLD
jgi:hypothetical protein